MLVDPTAAWNVRLSRERTRTVVRIVSMIGFGSALGAMGFGIFPRGPKTTPSLRPIVGIRGASERKKSVWAASCLARRLSVAIFSISSGGITRSATAFERTASSPEANTPTLTALPRPWGSWTSSSIRFDGTARSTSLRLIASSTVSTKLRFGRSSSAFLTAFSVSWSTIATSPP